MAIRMCRGVARGVDGGVISLNMMYLIVGIDKESMECDLLHVYKSTLPIGFSRKTKQL